MCQEPLPSGETANLPVHPGERWGRPGKKHKRPFLSEGPGYMSCCVSRAVPVNGHMGLSIMTPGLSPRLRTQPHAFSISNSKM